jgi:hypothetical protein
MGSRNPDRVPLAYRRRKCETVQQMIEQRWEVSSRCQVCRMELRVDLGAIACVRGPSFSLWNRKSRCKGLHCRGVVTFLAKAPGMGWHEPLETRKTDP